MADRRLDPTPTDPGSHDEIITKLSRWSVAETVARLSAVAAARGMKLFAEVDHSGEAKASGLYLRETKLIIFGNPRSATPLIQEVPETGLDLPLRVLAWSDSDQTKVTYMAPSALGARYGLSDQLVAALDDITEIVDIAIGR
jgi:uncharacterized protein (DUF302 family)